MFNTIVATEKLHNCQLCSTLQIFDQEIKIISVELPEETCDIRGNNPGTK